MYKHLRPFLAYLLTIAIVVTNIPMSANAEDATESPVPVVETENTETSEEPQVITELTEKRDEVTKYFAMSDGTIKACIYPQNVHYLEDGTYEEIDNTLVKSRKDGKNYYENKKNSFSAKIPESLKDDYVEFSDENGYVKFKLLGAGNQKLEKAAKSKESKKADTTAVKGVNDRATFKAVKGDVDITYDLAGNKLKETIVLSKKTKQSFVFDIKTSAAKAVVNNDNSISFFDKDGTEIYQMQAPYMSDAAGEYSNAVQTKLEKSKDGYTLTYAPDYKWLSEKERAYPVEIDPTLIQAIYKETVTDTYVGTMQNASNPDIRGGWDVLNIGKRTTRIDGQQIVLRGYIKFAIPSEIGANDCIVDAKLDLLHYTGGGTSVNGTQIDVHELTSSFSEGNTWWGNQPSYDPVITDYAMVNTGNYFAGSSLSYDSYNLTHLVNKWHNGGTNHGIVLKYHSDTTDVSTSQQVYYFAKQSVYYGSVSKFVEITYRNTTGLEDYWSYTQQECGQAGTGYVNNYNGSFTFIHDDVSNNTIMNSFTLSHVYNSQDYGSRPMPLGNRWLLNLMQYLDPVTLEGSSNVKYVYTDGDGTKHYFVQTDDGSMKDEDGLGYTLTEISEVIPGGETQLCYQIKTKDDDVLKFDNWHCLRQIFDANGNCINLKYTKGTVPSRDNNILTSIETSTGEAFTLNYDANNRLTGITDKADRVTSYEYDSENNLTTITYPDGSVSSYQYHSGRMTSVIAPDGTGFHYGYDGNSRVVRIATVDSNNAEGNVVSLDYKYNRTVVSDSQNRSFTYQFDTFGRPACVYDNEGNAYSQSYTSTSMASSEIFKNNKLTISSNGVRYTNNLFDNGSFTHGLLNWINHSQGSNSTAEIVTEKKLLTKNSVKLTAADFGWSTVYQNLGNLTDSSYTITAYIKTENVESDGLGAGIEFYTSNARYIHSEFLTGSTDPDINDGFEKLTATVNLEAGESIIYAGAGLYCAKGTVYIDCIQLESGSTPNNINFISNSSFENGDLGAASLPFFGACLNSSVSSSSFSGDKSFSIVGDPNSQTITFQSVEFDGKPGDTYSFGGWAKADAVPHHDGSESNFKLIMQIYNTDGSVQREIAGFNEYLSEWQFSSNVVIAEKAHSSVLLFLTYYNNCNTAFFDDLFLYRDTAQSYTYDKNGNVISTADYASQRQSFDYKGANLSRLVNPDGSDFEYSYGCAGRNNLMIAKSSSGLGYRFGYNIDNGSSAPTVSQTHSDQYSQTVTVGKCYYIRNRATGKNLQPYNCVSTHGTDVVQYSCQDIRYQKWWVKDAGDGYVYLEMGDATFNRLGVKDGNPVINQPVQMRASSGDDVKFKIVPHTEGPYYSIHTKLNESMAVCSNLSKLDDNNKILIYPYESALSDRDWFFVEADKEDYSEPQSGGTYYISDMSTYRYFDIPGFHTVAGTNLTQYSYLGGINQRYNLQKCGDYYMIIPDFCNHMALSVSENGTDITIQSKNESDTKQHFSIAELPTGAYRITPRNFSGKAISLPDGVSIPSGHLKTLDYTGKPWQQWRFEKVKDFNVSDDPQDGQIYYIRFNHNYQYLDIPDMRTVDGTAVTQYPFNSGVNQQFKLKATSDGYYNIIAMHSVEELLFTLVPDPASTNGSGTVQLFRRNNSAYQEFKFISAPNNTYRMVCRASASDDFCLEVPNGVNSFSHHVGYVPFVGNGANWQWLTLEKAGKVIRTTAEYSDNGNYMTSNTDSRGNTTSYTYDTSRDLQTAVTDARGTVTSYAYNSLNDRLISVSSGNSIVGYVYDSKGRLSTITSASGTQYSFSYDAAGRTTEIKCGSRTLSSTQYKDNYSSLVSQISYGNGMYKSYTYDNFDRVIGAFVNGTQTMGYTYDKLNRVYSVHDYSANITTSYDYDLIGRILAVKNSNGTAAYYSYDKYNRTSALKLKLPGINLKTEYLYGDNNSSGKRTDLLYGISLNGSEKLSYTYDSFNRLDRRIRNTASPFVTQYGYFEGADSSTTTTLVKTVKNGSDTLEYTYDALGNITTVSKNGIVIEQYSYDELNQLKSAVYGEDTYQYFYDEGGNLTEIKKNNEVIKSYSYGNSEWKDLLTSFNGEAITYDEIGNPLSYRNGMSFTWQNGRQLAGISKDGAELASYTYNAEGLRTSKTVNGATTDYYWLNGTLQGQKTGEESILFLYDENGNAYGFITKNGTGESTYYYEFNVQGDIIGIIDSTGTKVVEYTYGAWGELLSVTGTLADTIGQMNPLRYRGYYYDAETGFYYLTSRYYDAEIGRFVNADNAISGTGESVQGYNLFAYCFNNPVKMSDETGHWPYVFVAKVLMVTAIVTTTVNHIINAKNKNKINKEVKKTYTKKTAKKEIDGILKEYGKDIKVAFNENSVEIKNSAKVNSRYDRQKISTIITRTEELTERSCGNLSAEWFFHNVAYDMHIKRSSAISADLEYTKDKRKIVSVPTGLLEIFGWE